MSRSLKILNKPVQATAINYLTFLFAFILFISLLGCTKESLKKTSLVNGGSKSNLLADARPNILLILADDIGYEVPAYTGGQSYTTPNINILAQNNMQFTQCQAAPNCSPSRIMLMTGKYNFRNYLDWGILDTTQYCIANMLRDAGYATCIAGKWQLDGGDASLKKAGFDKYRIFLPFNPGTTAAENAENWYRYKNPHIYENGAYLADTATRGKYADDMFVDYIKQFINNNTSKPFFVYYPLSLCHYPFVPTPDDLAYATWTPESHVTNTIYFPSMVKYMDKKVGDLINYINTKGLSSNTIILFLSDNGTPPQIFSLFKGKLIQGGKGTTNQYGTHVPFIASWPGHITAGTINNNIINFPDFMPLLASIAGTTISSNAGIIDGVDFYPSFLDPNDIIRAWGFCQWKPYSTSPLRRWDQTLNYKLYDSINNSKFYNILTDTLEKLPILKKNLTANEKIIKQQLQDVLNQMH